LSLPLRTNSQPKSFALGRIWLLFGSEVNRANQPSPKHDQDIQYNRLIGNPSRGSVVLPTEEAVLSNGTEQKAAVPSCWLGVLTTGYVRISAPPTDDSLSARPSSVWAPGPLLELLRGTQCGSA
jgi:hypothetical protein